MEPSNFHVLVALICIILAALIVLNCVFFAKTHNGYTPSSEPCISQVNFDVPVSDKDAPEMAVYSAESEAEK